MRWTTVLVSIALASAAYADPAPTPGAGSGSGADAGSGSGSDSATTPPAAGDEVDQLVAQGEAFAKQSNFSRAIEVIKQADAKRPRAKHACLIGLAYTRRELWPEAELFFTLCRGRATEEDPLPTWIDNAERQLTEKLTATGAAAVTISVTPHEANPSITVSSFAPDEAFAPRTIHLAQGKHVLEVTASGYATATREVVVNRSDPQTITIELLTTEQAAAAAAAAKKPVVVVKQGRSLVPLAVILGGVALGVAGGAYEQFVFKPARDTLASAPTAAVYERSVSAFDLRRDVTIGLYVGAVAAVVTGIVLRYTVYDQVEAPVQVSASVGNGVGVVSLGWSR